MSAVIGEIVILWTCLFIVFWHVNRTRDRALRSGVGVLVEAHAVRSQYPFAYSQYRAEAVVQLKRLGLEPLIILLPEDV